MTCTRTPITHNPTLESSDPADNNASLSKDTTPMKRTIALITRHPPAFRALGSSSSHHADKNVPLSKEARPMKLTTSLIARHFWRFVKSTEFQPECDAERASPRKHNPPKNWGEEALAE